MQKLLLLSLLIMIVAIPMRAAADPSPARGLRRAVIGTVAYAFVYVMLIVYVLPRLPG
jgi:hypothetical protein